jgi:hypothetical protein
MRPEPCRLTLLEPADILKPFSLNRFVAEPIRIRSVHLLGVSKLGRTQVIMRQTIYAGVQPGGRRRK